MRYHRGRPRETAAQARARAATLAARALELRRESAELCLSAAELDLTARATLGRRLDVLTRISDEHPSPRVALERDLLRQASVIGRDPAIEDAKRILSERYAITRGDAFAILVHRSSRQRRKVRDVARAMIADGSPD